MDDTTITGRYATGTENTLGLVDRGELDEFSTLQSDSEDVFRLIRNSDKYGISNTNSLTAFAIRGAAPNEDPALATMWVLLGQPSYGIAVPAWAAVSDIPNPIETCAMYNAAMALSNSKGTKEDWVQAAVFPAEAHLFDMVNNRLLPHWRSIGGPLDVGEVTRIEHQMAQDAYSVVAYLADTGKHNLAPSVDFTVVTGSGHQVEFTPTAVDSDGSVVSYLWDFGDGSTSTETSPSYEYSASGVYLVSVTVSDDDGVTTTAWRYITVE
jgi:hypothetical protein